MTLATVLYCGLLAWFVWFCLWLDDHDRRAEKDKFWRSLGYPKTLAERKNALKEIDKQKGL